MDMFGNWNQDVQVFLEADCLKNGYPITDGNLLETLTEAESVYEEEGDAHRWWIDTFKVVKIGDKFIGYGWGKVTGDNGLSDTGWEFFKGSAVFCVPKTITNVIYVPKPSDG